MHDDKKGKLVITETENNKYSPPFYNNRIEEAIKFPYLLSVQFMKKIGSLNDQKINNKSIIFRK